MGKKRVNLYLDEDLYKRLQIASRKLKMPASEAINEMLTEYIDLLEVTAYTQDPQKIAEFVEERFMLQMSTALAEASQAIHTISQFAHGKESKG